MSEILFEKDIVKSVAEELGMSEAKIQAHMNFFKHFINEFAEGEVHTLQLPGLGRMYRNMKACANMNIWLEKTGMTKKHPGKYDEKMEANIRHILDMKEKLLKNNTTCYHNTTRRIVNPYFTCIKRKKELELFQNSER